jgi:hypothetical protein
LGSDADVTQGRLWSAYGENTTRLLRASKLVAT